MKTIDKLSFVPLLALLLFAGSCEKDGGVFMRENDAIACDCTEQSISQNVLCDGEWVADCGGVGVDRDHARTRFGQREGLRVLHTEHPV